MARLKVSKGGVELQSFDLDQAGKAEIRLGRAEGCDVRLDDRAVGREHAVLLFDPEGLAVRKKSRFGRLSLNGGEIEEGRVKAGDVIQIAAFQLRVEEAAAATGSLASVSGNVPEIGTIVLNSEADPGQIAAAVPELQPIALEGGQVPAEPGAANAAINLEQPVDVSFGSVSGQAQGAPPEAGDDRTAMIPPAKVLAKLVFQPGEANVTELVIQKGEIAIGRGDNCDVVLTSKKASRKHLVIRRAGMSFVARDLGSANGTYVNGVRITERELAGDDLIRIGESEFRFHAVSQDYQAQSQDFIPVPEDTPPPAEPALPAAQGIAPEAPGVLPSLPLGAGGSAFDPNQLQAAATGELTPKKKETPIEWFKRQPLPRKILVVVLLAALMFYLLNDEDDSSKKATKAPPKPIEKVDAAFATLPPEKQQFVINTYNLAFDLYKKQEFERAMYEVDKILLILPGGYKEAKEIKSYAQKAVETVKAAEEEKRRKQAEEKLRAEIAALVAQAQQLVDAGKDAEAKDVFAQVLEKDPDNPVILRLRQQMEEREQKRKADEEAARERAEKRARLEALLREGRALLKAGKYYEVMERMQEAPLIYAGDEKLLAQAKALIKEARETLRAKVAPSLAAGKAAMARSDYTVARDAYYQAIRIDSRNAEAKAGLAKISEILHEKSKKIYTEAIVAESVSDFLVAKAKFKECLDGSMKEDVYYGRCLRKYKRFEYIDRESREGAATPLSPAGGAGADPSMPMLPTPPIGSGEEKKP